MPLILAASGSMALSKASGPSRIAPLDLPAVGHLAQRRRVYSRRNLRRHRFDGGQDRDARRAMDDRGVEIDGVLDDVALGIEVGRDVDRGIGEEQRFGVGRHVHHKDVADASRGTQSGLRRGDFVHQLVGVEAALHQELALGLPDQLHALRRSRLAVRYIDNLVAVDREAVLAGYVRDLARRPHQNRNDDAGLRRLDRAAQRGLVAGIDDDRRRCGSLLGPGDEPLVLGTRRRGKRAERRDGSDFVLVSRHDRPSASIA
jgi:hypothetical protein